MVIKGYNFASELNDTANINDEVYLVYEGEKCYLHTVISSYSNDWEGLTVFDVEKLLDVLSKLGLVNNKNIGRKLKC